MPEPALAGLVALLLAAPVPSPGPAPRTFERAIEVAAPGRVWLALDAAVYDAARADLGDLRVVDDQGRPVPYVVDLAHADPPDRHRPVVRDRVFDRGAFARVTLDFGAPTLKDELALSLEGESFRRRVVVEGRDHDEAQWATLVDDAYVFAVPGPPPARYETIALPENEFRQLRLTVHHDPDDPARIEIRDAWTDSRARRRPREIALSVPLTRVEDAERRETILVLNLGARHRPFRGVVLDVADPRFWRGVAVEAREEPRPGRPLAWTLLTERAIYRYPHGPGPDPDAQARLHACGRARVLRLRVRNRDDVPLTIRAATVMVPVERVVFEAQPGRAYRLTYGDPRLASPSYDIARTAGDLGAFAAAAAGASLGPPRVIEPAGGPSSLPWTERHPALLWGGLLVVVLALGALTLQALREPGPSAPAPGPPDPPGGAAGA